MSGPTADAIKRYLANPEDAQAIATLSDDPSYVGQLRTTCVSTMIEGGLPTLTTVTYYGFLGPAGTPADVVARLNSEVNECLKSAELRASMLKVGFEPTGGSPQDFILDTGSEATVISGPTAQRERVRPITYTLSAGVGEVGLRGLQLARLDTLEMGTLLVHNLPVLIKNPALRGTISDSSGMQMMIRKPSNSASI